MVDFTSTWGFWALLWSQKIQCRKALLWRRSAIVCAQIEYIYPLFPLLHWYKYLPVGLIKSSTSYLWQTLELLSPPSTHYSCTRYNSRTTSFLNFKTCEVLLIVNVKTKHKSKRCVLSEATKLNKVWCYCNMLSSSTDTPLLLPLKYCGKILFFFNFYFLLLWNADNSTQLRLVKFS